MNKFNNTKEFLSNEELEIRKKQLNSDLLIKDIKFKKENLNINNKIAIQKHKKRK